MPLPWLASGTGHISGNWGSVVAQWSTMPGTALALQLWRGSSDSGTPSKPPVVSTFAMVSPWRSWP
eukprot:1729552-Lingulodinium_polyedra.AAC.1